MRADKGISRRMFIEKAAMAAATSGVAVALAARPALAAGHLPKLDPDDPQAKRLNYTLQSTTEGQTCSGCQFFQGGDKAWGECLIFPGKEVSATGWCSSWTKRAS